MRHRTIAGSNAIANRCLVTRLDQDRISAPAGGLLSSCSMELVLLPKDHSEVLRVVVAEMVSMSRILSCMEIHGVEATSSCALAFQVRGLRALRACLAASSGRFFCVQCSLAIAERSC